MTGSNPRVLLNTSVIIEWLNGVTEIVTKLKSSIELYIPVFALGELYTGAYRSSQSVKHLQQV